MLFSKSSKIKELIRASNNRFYIAILLGIFVTAYNFIWLNKSFTMSEGWAKFYSELINQGKLPYKDFYYYLPPLNLLIDFIICKLSLGYIFIYRLWRLAERVLIIEILYNYLSKKLNPWIACISGMLTCVLVSANVYDLCGDYNQTQQLIIVISAILLIKYSENINSNNRFKYILALGILGGIMFQVKQTLVLAAFISYIILLIVLVSMKIEKNYLKVVCLLIVGVILSLLPLVIYLICTKSYRDFIYQVYLDVSSKGSLYDIIFQRIIDVFSSYLLAILVILLVLIASQTKNNDSNNSPRRLMVQSSVSMISAVALILFGCYSIIISTLSAIIFSIIGILVMIQVSIFLLGRKTRISFIFVFAPIILTFFILINNIHNITNFIYEELELFGHMKNMLTILFISIIIWTIYHLVTNYKSNTPIEMDCVILSFASFASGYFTIMANGENSVATISAFTIIPTVFLILFRHENDHIVLSHKSIVAYVLFLFIFSICLSQKLVCSYSWWGDSEESYFEKTYSSDIKMLKGFKFSKSEIERYDKLNAVISANTTKDSVIWGFPYTKVYNLFQSNYNMNGFIPVEFYDTCADDYAKDEASLLSENPPDIVVWQDIPNCIETHEEIYRNGEELGQREIINWFISVKNDRYSLIGQVDNVFVYRLIDDSSTTNNFNTYIKSKYAVNETASKDLNLTGLGSKSIPYEIGSFDDLKYLQEIVNKGNNLEDIYFEQTADISCPEDNNWTPIGNKDSNGFAGIYNGNGYVIKNLYMLSNNDDDLSLFGKMDGTVYNLAVEGAWIGGRNVALIANSGSGNILNCYANGILYGYNCSGITYNVSGKVSNNVAIVTVEKGNANGIIGAYSEKLENNFSNISDISLQDSGLIIDKNSVKILNEYVDKYNNGQNEFTLLHWTDNGGIPHLTSE